MALFVIPTTGGICSHEGVFLSMSSFSFPFSILVLNLISTPMLSRVDRIDCVNSSSGPEPRRSDRTSIVTLIHLRANASAISIAMNPPPTITSISIFSTSKIVRFEKIRSGGTPTISISRGSDPVAMTIFLPVYWTHPTSIV